MVWTLSSPLDSGMVDTTPSPEVGKMENSKAPKIVLELIEAAKKATGVEADNALAVRLGWHRQMINHYKNGTKPNNENLLILCENAGWDFNKTLAEVEAAFASSQEAKNRWENLFRQLGGIAASFMMGVYVVVTLIVTSPDAQANESTTYKAESSVIQIMRSSRT
jgi:hypothetical protein